MGYGKNLCKGCSFLPVAYHPWPVARKKNGDRSPRFFSLVILLMVGPFTVTLAEDPVEDLAGARSGHLFVLNEDDVLRDLESSNLALAPR